MKRIGLYGDFFSCKAVSVIKTAIRSQCEFECLDAEQLTGKLYCRYRMIWIASFDGLSKQNEASLIEYVANGGGVLLFCGAGQRSSLKEIFTGTVIKGLKAKRQKNVFTIRHSITPGVSHWTTNLRISVIEQRNPLIQYEPLLRDMSSGLIAYTRQYALGRIVCCLWEANREMLEDAAFLQFLRRSGQWLQGKI